MITDNLPFLRLTDPGFSTRSDAVLTARENHWCARTPYGLAILRHKEAGLVLRDRRFRQGSHAWPDIVGLRGSFADFWKRSVISQEGTDHKALRHLAQNALAELHVAAMQPTFTQAALALCDRLKDFQTFDMIDGFTEPFAGQAIAALLGLAPSDAKAMASDATCLGFAMGPDAKDHQDRVNAAHDRLADLAIRLIDAPPRGSFVDRLLSGPSVERQALIDLVVIAIFGGVDTTRAQLTFAAHLFARHPEQWTWLRANPDALPAAIDEVIHMRPTTTWATREALEDVTLDGLRIPKGETLHILVHATSTDPRTGHSGRFDIRAGRKSHFGFGGGVHHCLGHLVAKTDMAAALNVWLGRWASIELAGDPTFSPDSGNTSPLTLPVRPVWDT